MNAKPSVESQGGSPVSPPDDTLKPTRLLLIAVGALFLQQTLVAMSRLVMPVMMPVIAEDLGINPAYIGAYSGILSASAVLMAMAAGGFIERLGAWRVCQVALVLAGIGMFVAMPGFLILFAIAAVLVSPAPGMSTPASSHVLAGQCTPKQAPFYFSIKQTGVPAGGLLAGILVPFLALNLGWQGALMVTGVLYIAVGLLLQPFRGAFDVDRHPGHRSFLADAKQTLKLITSDGRLRELVVAAFTFVGLQSCFDTFFTAYLVNGLGHPLTIAGTVFAVGQGVAIFTRILWGTMAGRIATPRQVLAGLGLAMAASAVGVGLFAPAWPILTIGIVAVLYTATAFSWHGVLLAEVARLAPPGRVGATTGGLLVFIMASSTLYPLALGAIVGLTGSYGAGYMIAAVPALLVGIRMLRRRDKPVDETA